MDVQTEFDVVVLGTGAAGLTAAIVAHDGGASVGLFEKAGRSVGPRMVGGCSGPADITSWRSDRRQPRRCHDVSDVAVPWADGRDVGCRFIDTGPEMVRWLEANTPVMFQVVEGFPDYHPEHPGAKRGGRRSLECPLFAFDELRLGGVGDRWSAVGRNITMSETSLGRGAPQGVPAEEMQRRRIHDERGAGQGLVGRLLKGCLDRGIEPAGAAATIW